MPPPQYHPVTKYYFGNIDSLSAYKFYIKNSETGKTYKIKQNAVFEVYPNEKDGPSNKLEVWAINKETKLQTNTISLYVKESFKPLEENTAHYAVTLSFDKNKVLTSDFSMLTMIKNLCQLFRSINQITTIFFQYFLLQLFCY